LPNRLYFKERTIKGKKTGEKEKTRYGEGDGGQKANRRMTVVIAFNGRKPKPCNTGYIWQASVLCAHL